LTVHGQQYVPGDRTRSRILLPLVFCRECGQEYYCVRYHHDDESGARMFTPRELSDHLEDEENKAGFLYFSSSDPWPEDIEELIERLPDEWVEDAGRRIRRSRIRDLPQPFIINARGHEDSEGLKCHFVPVPFRFCLNCGVSYQVRKGMTDYARLGTLATEGKSSATTILSLSAIRNLRADETLPPMLASC